MVVAAMAAITEAVMVVAAMAAITEAVMVAVIIDLDILIQILLLKINLLVLKAGKIEVLEKLLKILNMKVVEVEEEEEFLMKQMYLKKRIRIPFLSIVQFVLLRNL